MLICRLCLTSLNNGIEIVNNQELLYKIRDCVSIEVSPTESYSKYICCPCSEKLNEWHIFKTMCLKSDLILRSKCSDADGKKESAFQLKDALVDGDFKNFKTEEECLEECFHHISISTQNPIKCDTDQKIGHGLDTTDLHLKSESLKSSGISNITPETVQTQDCNKCDICNKEFEFYTDYLDHQLEHNGEALFSCLECKMTFSTKIDLVTHEKNHRIPCDICGTRVLKKCMKLHQNKHTDKFKCSECSTTFTCESLLREHVMARHMKLKIHCCDFCGKDFATKSSLKLHLKTHSDERKYKCSQCDYAGRTSISLRIHMAKHEVGTYICQYCPKIFKSNRNLGDHIKRVHCSEKKHSCSLCGMKFALRYLLENHQRTHTGIHPYKCSQCSKTFARADSLKEHKKTHDRSEVFKCIQCLKVYLSKRSLRRHNCKSITDEDPTENEEPLM